MSDEADYRNDVNRGEHAKRLLEDPLLTEAFDTVDAKIVEDWRAVIDPAQRDRLWLMLQLLGKLKGHLKTVVDGGTLANTSLVEIEKKKKFRLLKGKGE